MSTSRSILAARFPMLRLGSSFVLAAAIILAFTQSTRAQTIIYVNAAAPGGNGLSWAQAHFNLEQALTAAADLVDADQDLTVEVWVATGTYIPAGAEASFWLRDRIHLLGGFVGTELQASQRDPRIHTTVLAADQFGNDVPVDPRSFPTWTAGNLRGDNVRHIVRADDTTSAAVIDGFIISGGFAAGDHATPDGWGGGIAGITEGSSPTIRRCTFINNLAARGGGIFLNHPADALIDSCIFLGNAGGVGGGIALGPVVEGGPQATVTVQNCVFSGNSAYGYGAALYGETTNLTVLHCTFSGNAEVLNAGPPSFPWAACCGWYGASASMMLQFGCQTLARNCVFWEPTATGDAVVPYDGPGTITYDACITTEPSLADPDGIDGLRGTIDDDLRPAPGSPCIDTGSADTLPHTDILGNRRFHDADNDGSAQPDIGAYELGAPPYSPTLYVREFATGANNGSSWTDAYSGTLGLRSALATAAADPAGYPEIWIGAGTYKPAGPCAGPGCPERAESFQLHDGLSLYGGFAAAGGETDLSQRNPAANPTILSGDLNGDDIPFAGSVNRLDNSFHVVTAIASVVSAVLDGFTIQNGNPAGASGDDLSGGALWIRQGATPIIRSCSITDCDRGAVSIYNDNPAHNVLGPAFESCVFTRNRGNAGAAVGASQSTTLFRDCVFEDNVAAFDGGAVQGYYRCGVYFLRCRFTRNAALQPLASDPNAGGGAIWIGSACPGCDPTSVVRLVNCVLEGNRAVGRGGALLVGYSSGFEVFGSILVGNVSEQGPGGAIYLSPFSRFAGLRHLTNCSIISNHAPRSTGGGIHCDSLDPHIVRNTIFWANTSSDPSVRNGQFYESSGLFSAFNMAYSTVEAAPGSLPGQGNLVSDPGFVSLPAIGADETWGTLDDSYGDLQLANASPAIDSASSPDIWQDSFDVDDDGNVTEALPLDLVGNARFIDAPLIPNTGVGSPPVDRGAIEYSPPTCTPGGSRLWTNSLGGDFSSDLNWFPCAPDSQSTCLLQTPSTYTISFTPNTPVSAQSLTATRGHPTLNLNASTLSLTSGILPSLVVGDAAFSTAQLTVTDGTLIPFTTRVGSQLGSDGTLTLSGPTTHLLAQDDLCAGCFGRGTLRIESGARLFTPTAGIGDQPGSDGSLIEVTGSGGPGDPSTWDIAFLATINRGTLNVTNGGVVNVGLGLPFTALYLFRDGTITGDGTINGNVVNFGNIAPGNSPGTLTINGGYSQVGTFPELGPITGRIDAQVAGPAPAQHDRLHVNGPVTLGGGLFVTLEDNYTPSPNDSIPLVTSNQPITTQFDVAFFPALPPPPQGQNPKFLRAIYNPRGGGGVSLIVQDLNGDFGFDPNPQQSFDGFPTAAAIGDLDRDTFPDLVITFADPAGNNDAVVLLRNQGNSGGNWQGFAAITQQIGNVGDQPSGVVIGDFDGGPGGGGNDLAVSCRGSNVVTIYQQQQASPGNFTRVQDIAVGAEPSGLCAADLDRDGRDDLAVTNFGSDDLSVLINGSSPDNTAFVHFPVRFPTRPRPLSPRPTRPDIDKDRDIVVVNGGAAGSEEPGGVSVLVNTLLMPGDSPSFAAPIGLPVGRGPVQVVSAGLRARDPGDPREDLVAINLTDGSASVIVNTTPNNAPGDQASYAPAVTYPFATNEGVQAQPRSIAAIDADRDGPGGGGEAGDLDIAILTNSADGTHRVVRVLRNDSVGGQTQVALVELPALDAGADDPVALLVADVDRDNQGIADDLIIVGASGLGSGGEGRVDVLLNALLPACRADFNNNGQVTAQDIFDFLAAFFTPGNMAADFNQNGQVTAQDIFDFLAAFFAGCA